MGIDVLHTLTGCTYLCQAINIRINKPIKTCVCQKLEDWMVDGEGIVDSVAKDPFFQNGG